MTNENMKELAARCAVIANNANAAAFDVRGRDDNSELARIQLFFRTLDELRAATLKCGGANGGDLPFLCGCVEKLLMACDWGGVVSAHFFTNGEDGEECDWDACKQVTVGCENVSDNRNACDLGFHVCAFLATLCGFPLEGREHDRDGAFETMWLPAGRA